MDLTFTADEEAFRADLRSWLSSNIPSEWTRPGFWATVPAAESFRLRRDWEATKSKAGFEGITWPVEYGGRGGTHGMQAIYDEEMVRAHAPHTCDPAGLPLLAPTVMAIGTDAQKRDVLGSILRHEVTWCQGFSEPGAGSDLAALRTRGEIRGDRIIVNGQKIWTTNAVFADRMFALVRTDPTQTRHRGISMLLIDLHQSGVDIRPIRQLNGESEFGEVFLTDVEVPIENCLGALHDGWSVAMLLLSFERGASGIAQYTEFRQQWDAIMELADTLGRADDPAVRQEMSACLVELECLRYHAMHVLTKLERDENLGFEASITKLQWSETFQRMWQVFEDLLGADTLMAQPRGGLDLAPMMAHAAWARSVTIWGGSSQVQRNIVAERVLGLPR